MKTPPCSSLHFLLSKFTTSSHHLNPNSNSNSNLTIKTCSSLLRSCESNKKFEQILAQIILTPTLNQSPQILANLIIFSTTTSQPDRIEYAIKIFDTFEREQPSLFLYNLMIKALCKRAKFGDALNLFDKMRDRGLPPDSFTFPFVLKSIAGLKAVSEGRKAHALIVKSGFEFDPFSRISLMDMYMELGFVGVSRVLFDGMPERGVVAWNAMISGYVKCRRFEEALSVFEEMERDGVRPDEATLVGTLSACVPLQNSELGRRIHRYMDEEVGFTVKTGNALLDMYTKCGRVDSARRLFDAMPVRNVISWTSMIHGYLKLGRMDEARQMFDCSPLRDVVLWTAMINGYVQYGRIDQALAMFEAMQTNRVKPDKFTLVALLTACARTGALQHGKSIHQYIRLNKIQLDTIVGTALIDMYAKCGSINESMEVFRQMDTKDGATWGSIIYGTAINGRASDALELFAEMRRLGVEPDRITFVGVLTACSHGGLVEEGRRVFRDMQDVYRLEPGMEHYGCLAGLLGRAGRLDEAEDLIRSIPNKNDKDVLPLWIALLGACRIHDNSKTAERLAEEILKLGNCNADLRSLVANVYAAVDRWEDADTVRKTVKHPCNNKKTPGFSFVEVNDATCAIATSNAEK